MHFHQFSFNVIKKRLLLKFISKDRISENFSRVKHECSDYYFMIMTINILLFIDQSYLQWTSISVFGQEASLTNRVKRDELNCMLDKVIVLWWLNKSCQILGYKNTLWWHLYDDVNSGWSLFRVIEICPRCHCFPRTLQSGRNATHDTYPVTVSLSPLKKKLCPWEFVERFLLPWRNLSTSSSQYLCLQIWWGLKGHLCLAFFQLTRTG